MVACNNAVCIPRLKTMMSRQIIFFSLIALTLGIILWRRGNRLLREGMRSQATVVSNRYERDADGDGGVYYPNIHFVTHRNENVKKELSIGTIPKREVGTTLNIIYDPENPSDFVVSPTLWLEVVPRILVAGGISGITIAVLDMCEVISVIPE